MKGLFYSISAETDSYTIAASLDGRMIFMETHCRTPTGSRPAVVPDPDTVNLLPDDVVDVLAALNREGLSAMNTARAYHMGWHRKPDDIIAQSLRNIIFGKVVMGFSVLLIASGIVVFFL